MVFKLVRIDAEEPSKIRLPLGTHLIGRGKFLECEDKRISRNHGHLIVTEDSVVIEALHQNPCFFTKKSSEEKQVLKKSFKETLDTGDRFGLLPGSYWYEVLCCSAETDSQATDVSNTPELDAGEPRADVQMNDKTLSDNAEVNDKTISANSNEENGNNDIEGVLNEKGNDEDSVLDFDLNETVENTGRAESPSLLDQQNEPEQSIPSTTNSTDPPERPEVSQTEESPKPTGSKSPKRSHSIEEEGDVKRIKTEPVEVKEELLVKQEPDGDGAGPSSDQADQAGASSATDGNKAPPSPPPPRERCIYGADCYRRNPTHKAQFAHPRDTDWGAGEQPPCPYGAACRKREPRHWRVHSHPPGTRPPDARPPPPVPRPKKKRQRRQSSDSGSDSEHSDPATLVLTTKRARKPLPKLDSQDSDNEDPFASDGSDEWFPPSDYTETPDF